MAASKLVLNSVFVSTNKQNKTKFDAITANISAIFFDLDNTLIPTRTGDSKAIRKLADVLENQFAFTKDESIAATQQFLKSFRRCPDNSQTSLDSWRTYLWRESLPARHKRYAEQIYSKWLQLRYRYLALPPDYVQLLRRFRQTGYLLALITNGPSNAQWEKIHKLNVRQYFDCIFVSSDMPWEKPHPNIFYAACKLLNTKPHQCVMIGDKLETDIKGGHLANLGLTFWTPLATSNSTGMAIDDFIDISYPPDIILANLLDIYKYFPKLNANVNNTNSTNNIGLTNTANLSSSSPLSSPSSSPSSSSSSSASSLLLTSPSSSTSSASSSFLLSSATPSKSSSSSSVVGISSVCGMIAGYNGSCTINAQSRRRSSQISGNKATGTCDTLQSKYRRGGSLPAIECFNSETDNSCDSTI